MAQKYGKFRLPLSAPTALKAFVREHIDPRFEEFEFLLSLQIPGVNAKGSLQHPLAVLLCSLCDASAQLLLPDQISNKKLFVKFLMDFYPWDRDEPLGMTRREACEEMWSRFRNPLTHRFGLGANNAPARTKVGRAFTPDVPYLNAGDGERPGSKTFLVRDPNRIVLWIDAFYWGLRRAIERLLSEPARWPLIEAHIRGARFIR